MTRPPRKGESIDSIRRLVRGDLVRGTRTSAATIAWLSLLGFLCLLVTTPVRAECGGNINCIAVSIEPGVQPSHGTPLESAPLGFGNQDVGTTSATRTVRVRHVGSRDGLATIQSITLGGADAGDFSLAGGDCVIGTPSLPRNGASCNILVTFNPASSGLKNASLAVASPRITRTVPLTGFGDDGSLPDPSEDNILPGLTRSQTDAARRFSATQTANIHYRMEALRRGASAGSANSNPASLENESLLAQSLLQLASNGSISLAALDSATGSGEDPASDRWWVAGDLYYGTREDEESGGDRSFSSDGISIGLDRRFSRKLAAGFSIGLAESDSKSSSGPTKSSAESTSLAAYASYMPRQQFFVDGLIGFGDLSFDSDRFDQVANDVASSSRDGSQLFASVAAGYQAQRNGLLMQPYARLDISRDTIDSTTESGVGALNLEYDEENLQTVRLSLGMLLEAPHATSFGWIMPRLRVEIQHEDESNADASVSYASQSGTDFTIVPSDHEEQTLLLGVGGRLFFMNGMQLDIEYRGMHSPGSEASQLISLNLSGNLDGSPVAMPPETISSDDPIVTEFGYSSHTNVNQASEDDDERDDRVVDVAVRKQVAFGLSRLSRFLLTGSLALADHRKHQGLDNLSGSVQGEFEYRPSNRFTAPTYGAYGRAALDSYESDLRSGVRSVLGVKLDKPMTDRLELSGSLERRSRSADEDVFDTDDTSLRLFADIRLSRNGIFSLGFELRDGDTVTSSPGSNAFSSVADEIDTDDAYFGEDLFAYRFEAETRILTLAYNLRLGPQDTLDIALQNISAEPNDSPSGGDAEYESQKLSLFYLIRF